MATTTLNTRIAQKIDTTANWSSSTLVLLKGEQAFEITESNGIKLKVGDGVKTFSELDYVTLTPTEITNLITSNSIQTVVLASGTNNGTLKLTVDGKETDNIAVKGLGSAAFTNTNTFATAAQGTKADNAMPKSGGIFTGAVTLNADPTANLHAATKQYVDSKISAGIAASDAMVFKGTLGSSGTATSLPTSGVVVGDTYKVITQISISADNSYTAAAVTAKVGDLVVAMDKSPKWIVVPSGDEIVTTVKYSTTSTNLTTVAQSGAITLGEASIKQVDTSISSGSTSTNLPTSKAIVDYVTWSNVAGKPSTFTPTAHKHTKADITDFPAALKNPNSLIIKLNGGSTEGTSLFTYDGSGAKIINITPSAIGAATSGHTHNYAGSSSAGGAATSAVKLSTARNFSITGGAVATAVSFDGSANVALSVSTLNTDYLVNGSNTLIFACGGAA